MFQHTAARRRLHLSRGALGLFGEVSTHSRPKAAAPGRERKNPDLLVSTHSRPKAAASYQISRQSIERLFQHTAARRRLPTTERQTARTTSFQHTAARRRLRHTPTGGPPICCFNTQPPEGGCKDGRAWELQDAVSTHSRPKAAALGRSATSRTPRFQHTAARRRLPISALTAIRT